MNSHLDHRTIARALLALLCALQGLATLAIDLNRTHATNPTWTRHARFHLVWQDVSCFLLSVLAVALIYWPGPDISARFYLAAALASIPMFAFLLAALSLPTYGGAFSDPNGIKPARLALFGAIRNIDLNLAAELAALVSLAAILAIYSL